MKKGFLFVAFALFALVGLTSCGGGTDTPEATAETYAKCLKNADWEGLADLGYYSERMTDKEVENAKKVAVVMLEVAGEKTLEKKEGIKDIEVKDVETDDDGERATCKVKYTYGDGSKDTETLRLVKTDDGWRIRM